jgi:hypothetical protein
MDPALVAASEWQLAGATYHFYRWRDGEPAQGHRAARPQRYHGGARSGAGRPTKAGANRRESIALRATEAEKAELVAAASAAGQSLSDFLIEAGLQRARKAS